MPRSLQDVLRAGQARSRANAPRVLQTRLEREEEIREQARRMVHAKDFKEGAKEFKHAMQRNWEEAKNEVDIHQGARDCFAEREDLWKQVEGMEALRETNNHLRHALKATDEMMEMANRDAKRMLESIRAKTKETEALLKAEREYLQTIEGRLAFDSDYPWPSMEALAAAKCTRHALTLTIVNLEADVAWLHALKRMAESGWPG
jgi:hypothetical protein